MLKIRLLLLAALAVAPQIARAADQASLRLEWTILGGHSPFYMAKEKGYFADEGIDLTITPGNGSAKTVAIVGTNGATFGIADGASLIRSVAQGLPVKMIGVIANGSPFCLTVRRDSGITALKDIEGKSIAFTAGSAQASVFPAILELNHVDRDKVKLVNLDPSGAIAAVADGRVQGQLAGADGQPLVLEARGIPMQNFMFNDLGVTAIGKGIVANDRLIKENPDLIRRFLRAVKRGFEDAQKHPSEAAKYAVAAQDPAARMTPEMIERQLEINLDLIESPNTKGKPFLTSSVVDWQNQLDTLKKYGDLKTDLPPTAFFTNEFIP